jgi:hypothetical protein
MRLYRNADFRKRPLLYTRFASSALLERAPSPFPSVIAQQRIEQLGCFHRVEEGFVVVDFREIRARSLRVAVVVFVVIIVIFFAVAFVFLFVFFLVWLLSKEDIGSYRPIWRV